MTAPEKKAYARGYAAGARAGRKASDVREDRLDRYFCAVLATMNDADLDSSTVAYVWMVAKEALRQRPGE